MKAKCHFCKQESFFTLVIGEEERISEETMINTQTTIHWCADHTRRALTEWYYAGVIVEDAFR